MGQKPRATRVRNGMPSFNINAVIMDNTFDRKVTPKAKTRDTLIREKIIDMLTNYIVFDGITEEETINKVMSDPIIHEMSYVGNIRNYLLNLINSTYVQKVINTKKQKKHMMELKNKEKNEPSNNIDEEER